MRGRIGWGLAASDFIEWEEASFKWKMLINAVNGICPIAIVTIRLSATLYELMNLFGRMHTIKGVTMELVDGGLGYLFQFITESDNIYIRR